jgi:putative transposase
MKEVRPLNSMDSLCGLFGITRQAYYQYQNREGKQALVDEIVLKIVRDFRQYQPKVGVRKLYLHLVEPLLRHGISIGRDALFDLLRKHNMLVRRRKRRHITTNSNHPYRKYPNLIKEFIPLRANELWVSDITYLETQDGVMYLSLITDAYSHKIVGWHLSQTLETKGPLRALQMALLQRTTKHPLIHHSDRGVQYCSHDYTNLLNHPNNQIKISMTETGDPRENPVAERLNGILKNELLPSVLASKQHAQSAIEQSVKTYNQVRLHNSVNDMTPQQAHQQQGLIVNKWKPKNPTSKQSSSFTGKDQIEATDDTRTSPAGF